MSTVISKPYPKHWAGLATIPLYLAALIPVVLLARPVWLSFLFWLPCWVCIDFCVSRFVVWQVNSSRRPIRKALLTVVLIGCIADAVLVGLFYALSCPTSAGCPSRPEYVPQLRAGEE